MTLRKLLSGVLPLALAAAWLAAAAHAQEDQLNADIRLFTVMAALNVAGYDDSFGSPSDSPMRRALREELADFEGSSLGLLKNFYEQFKLDEPGENLSQYVSFALLCEGPPEFGLHAELPSDLPPDVRAIRSFSRVLAEFYQQAQIERLWDRYQAAYDHEIARYQEPLIEALFEAGGYLRVSPTGREQASFKVFFDLLGAPNSINTRSYKGNVYVVVHHSKEPRIDEIRHAYLLHLLDPLSIRYAEEVSKKEVLSRFALFAPALPETYKSDFQLLASKSLVKAVEARLARVSEEQRRARVERELRQGYILTPYFYEKLPEYERQEKDMRGYYPELINGIDPKREAARLQQTTFAAAPSQPARPAARPKFSKHELLLDEAERLLAADKLSQAAAKFSAVLEESGGKNAQASYGLARVAVSEAKPDLALSHFTQAIASQPDPPIEAMSHIYIARIEDIMGNREQAVEHYRLALATAGIPRRARELAEKGLQTPFERPGGAGDESQPEGPDENGELPSDNEP